ncbi:MAG: COQ9 family protein [Paracoccaceae bacterium]
MERENGTERAAERLLEAALPHVAFDGWSEATFRAAVADSGVAEALARALYPRGGIDLALAWHRQGDRRMADILAQTPPEGRIRDRIAHAVMTRLRLADREAVRRGSALMALPQHAGDGAAAIWGTADAIWRALGDTSGDVNWYSKRATLSAVYGATVLFWLGDDSADATATQDFLDRRLGEVMQVEKLKAAVRDNPVARRLLAVPFKLMSHIRAPAPETDLPGRTSR